MRGCCYVWKGKTKSWGQADPEGDRSRAFCLSPAFMSRSRSIAERGPEDLRCASAFGGGVIRRFAGRVYDGSVRFERNAQDLLSRPWAYPDVAASGREVDQQACSFGSDVHFAASRLYSGASSARRAAKTRQKKKAMITACIGI